MRIDPAIAALRADRGLHRRAQRAMFTVCDAWRALPSTAQVLAELELFGAGKPLHACKLLEQLFTGEGPEVDWAADWVASLASAMLAVMADEPFAHPPLRHGYDGAVSTLLLARAGKAHLTLHAREPGEYDFAQVSFSEAVRVETVLAGSATARIVQRTADRFQTVAFPLAAGDHLAFDLTCQALQVNAVATRLVTLRLHRFAAEPNPTRSYFLVDGSLLHQASGDLTASRQEMMLAVLGRMGIEAAAPVMSAIALEQGDMSMRWQALRECLALNTEAGFHALLGIARAPLDPLAHQAGTLRASLVEAYPSLLALEEQICHA